MSKKMCVVLPYVMSLNGKITKGNNTTVSKWFSVEDQAHFKELYAQHNVIIRSSKTFDATQSEQRNHTGKRIIVMTRTPEKYKHLEAVGVLEFTGETPKDLCKRLLFEGVDTVLLSVGSTIATMFFEKGLVDRLIITIEPYLFSHGIHFLSTETILNVNLSLCSHTVLNQQGTLLLTYNVLSEKSSSIQESA